MSRKLKVILPAGLGVLLLGWLGLSILLQREPSYNGKRLSDWAQQFGENNWGTNRVAAEEAKIAIQYFGTNGIPFFVDCMRKRDSILKAKLRKTFPRKWHEKLHLEEHSGDIRRVGAHGIAALGTNAALALPSLLQCATNHPDEDGRYIAVFAIRALGSAAEPAVPFLIQCLTNSVNIIRDEAALNLGYNRLSPEIAGPALVRYVNFAKTSSTSFELRDAVDSLVCFSPIIVFPFLLPMLDDPSPSVREYVTNAIARLETGSADATTVLGIADGHFTINNRPAFLLGFSYFAALGAPDDFVRQDLNAFQLRRFNCLRVFATWNAFGTDFSAVDSSGKKRTPFFEALIRLIKLCDRRGIVVDVTLARGKGALPDFNSQKLAVATLVNELRTNRNWYLDLSNEHDVRDERFVSNDELKELRAEVRRLDPNRLVTASFGGHDLSPDEIRTAVLTIGLDFMCPHRPRDLESPGQTFAKTTNYVAVLKQIGSLVPVHYQEPFRRDYGDWQPGAEDFLADLRGGINGGAAGWCFHNGAAPDAAGNGLRRCFDLRLNKLFDQLDAEERKFLDEVVHVALDVPKRTDSLRANQISPAQQSFHLGVECLMGSTRGSTLRNRRTVLLALILAAASAVAAILLTRAKETPHIRRSVAQAPEPYQGRSSNIPAGPALMTVVLPI
jgi:HEAT repeat